MTGRDLIVYILQNNLEDKPVFEDGKFIGFMTPHEAAVKFEVGVATIKTWIDLHWIDSISFGGVTYIPADADAPNEKPQVVMNGVEFYVR